LPPLPLAFLEGLDQRDAWRSHGGHWTLERSGATPAAFSQIVPTVQVLPPRGSALRIQMAAGDSSLCDVGWSGDTELLPRRRLRTKGVLTDVDHLQLRHPARRWRLRLTALGGEPWRWRWGLASVTWRGRGRHALWCTPPPMDRRVAIRVPSASQMAEGGRDGSQACSPTSIQMLLAHRGIRLSVPEVMRTTWDPLAKIYGNWQKAIEAAWRHRCPGALVFFRHWGQVLGCLKAGVPLAASIKFPRGKVDLPGAPIGHSGGHLIVIRGLTPEGDVLVNDSAAQTISAVPRSYPLVPLSRAWFGFSGMGYLIFAPKRRK
ncbi:C39 family peptidase, partial [Candidatus Sumerlaeota bacterium]|nr:C39 family peptidase [Candidatus Sumerlaeota bacterium]